MCTFQLLDHFPGFPFIMLGLILLGVNGNKSMYEWKEQSFTWSIELNVDTGSTNGNGRDCTKLLDASSKKCM